MAKRAMSHEKASAVKLSGHAKEKEFAKLIGLNDEYKNDKKAKKDVIDFNGDAHSVKSGAKKWQVFLYGANRLANDYGFLAMNGMGQLLKNCLDVFPANRNEYEKNKAYYKELLQKPMIELKEKLQSENRRKAFLSKAFFNGGEVQYLTIFSTFDYVVRVFFYEDVVDILAANTAVENSQARRKDQSDNQKVVFKCDNATLGEIELRNDSDVHYKEIKFWVSAPKMIELLTKSVDTFGTPKYINGVENKRVMLFGNALKKFKI